MDMDHPKDCVNCGAAGMGTFCQVCAQPIAVKRITPKSVMREIAAKAFGFDNRFVRTVWHGFTKPGRVAATYIEGNRRRYLGPLSYFLLITTMYLLFVNLTDFDYTAYTLSSISPEMRAEMENDGTVDIVVPMTIKFSQYTRTAYAVNALFLAFPIWLFFRKREKINLFESLSAALYISAQTILLALLSLVTYYFFSLNSAIAMGVLNFFLSAWLVATLFTPRPSFVNFIKGSVAVVLSGILAGGVAVVVMLVGFYFFEDGIIRWLGLEGFGNP